MRTTRNVLVIAAKGVMLAACGYVMMMSLYIILDVM